MASEREVFDFSGWATRHNIRCSDGRTIRHGAFKDNDGDIVPLLYQHNHNDPKAVIGHALLENRDEGVYAYCALNNSDEAISAKEAVRHGDIDSLSIYANKLKQNGGDVLHGNIREVSLVLHGANPGAFIDNIVQHGDTEVFDDCGEIYNGEMIDTETEYELVDKLEHAEDGNSGDDEETIKDVFDAMSDKQKAVVYFMVQQATAQAKGGEVKQSEEGGNTDMRQNVFDQSVEGAKSEELKHMEELKAKFPDIMDDLKKHRYQNLNDAIIAHAEELGMTLSHEDLTYGIKKDIDWLYPDPEEMNTPPGFIKRDDSWVGDFMGKVKKSPFSRLKATFADITALEARAKGYAKKGQKKKEEVITLMKRTTQPTTIYKKQKFDRDDIVDITSFDILAWIRSEMDMMLKEEVARAALVGDGREGGNEDKIDENCIRPIFTDDDLYSIKDVIMKDEDETGATLAQKIIDEAVRSRKDYEGTGTPTMYLTEDLLSEMLLLKDGVGRRLYPTIEQLATAMRVSKIQTVPVMENQKYTGKESGAFAGNNAKELTLQAIIVNPNDYVLGSTRGGQSTFFEQFDIDFNQQKYLLETRLSGSLMKPKTAIVIATKEYEAV